MAIDLKILKEKFFTDPDWSMMEELILEYITPLESVLNIDPKLSNDEIATEVRGRQLAYKGMSDFLEQSQILRPKLLKNVTSYK